MNDRECLRCGGLISIHARTAICCDPCYEAWSESFRHPLTAVQMLDALYATYWARWERNGSAARWRNLILTEYVATTGRRTAA